VDTAFQPEAEAGRALWEQLREHLLERFRPEPAAGRALLPSVRDIASTCGVSIGTVSRVYDEWDKMGLLERVPRRGVFLRALPPDGQGAAVPGLTGGGPDTTAWTKSLAFWTPEWSGVRQACWIRLVERFLATAPDLSIRGEPWDYHGDQDPRQADVAMFDALYLSKWAQRGALRRLDGLSDLIPQEDRQAIPTQFFEAGWHDGDCYALPLGCSGTMVFYNLDLLESLGMSPPSAGMNWLEVADAAVAVGRQIRREGRADIWSINVPTPGTLSGTALLTAPDWYELDMAERHADALRSVWEFYARLSGCPEACWRRGANSGGQWEAAAKDFRDGRLAMMIYSGQELVALNRNVPFRFGAMPSPASPDGRHYGSLMMLGIGFEATDPFAAGRWIAHLASRAGQEGLAREKLYLPVHVDVAASAAWDDGDFEGAGAIAQTLTDCGVVKGPYQENLPVMVVVARPLAARLLLGEIDVETACDMFRRQHRDVLSSPWTQTYAGPGAAAGREDL
jgi:ABC-type glycerol-3-phosphate transport system substrate-binding protein